MVSAEDEIQWKSRTKSLIRITRERESARLVVTTWQIIFWHHLGNLNNNLVHEIEHFFVSYNETKGKKFEVLGRFGPERAKKLIELAGRKFRKSRRVTSNSRKPAK